MDRIGPAAPQMERGMAMLEALAAARPLSALAAQAARPVWRDLREFTADLERHGDLKRLAQPVDRVLEVAACCRHSLQRGGPALRFDQVPGAELPVLGNLWGSERRVWRALGVEDRKGLRDLGHLLAFFRSPGAADESPLAGAALLRWAKLRHLRPRRITDPPWREVVTTGEAVDLSVLPITTCWPGDAGPLLTFGLVVTRGTRRTRHNVAIYRQQVIGRNRLIMRWLPHRGGALDFRDFTADRPSEPFPLAVVIGADPAMQLAAVAPAPDTVSEYQLAALLRGGANELARCTEHDLWVPAHAEIVLEGRIAPGDLAREGPFCDHTGHYGETGDFPVFTVSRISRRADAVYHTSYMGRPPDDEPSVLAAAFNEMFIPLLHTEFPEIVDFYLPPAACSYRLALVSIRKQYAGHARRVMLGIWSWLRQFTYTKYIIVTDDDIDVRAADQVLWAVATRADPVRDTLTIDKSPIDYLDFASPVAGLGGKLGLDATRKWPGECDRPWRRCATPDPAAAARAAELLAPLGL